MNRTGFFLLQATGGYDTWETFSIYKGSGQLNNWSSFAMLAGVLLSVGIMIRGTVIVFKAINSPSPGETLRGLTQLIIGAVVVAILWVITGAM